MTFTQNNASHLIAELRDSARRTAIARGQDVERAKVEGVKLRHLRPLEQAHKIAWQRFYALDNMLTEA